MLQSCIELKVCRGILNILDTIEVNRKTLLDSAAVKDGKQSIVEQLRQGILSQLFWGCFEAVLSLKRGMTL